MLIFLCLCLRFFTALVFICGGCFHELSAFAYACSFLVFIYSLCFFVFLLYLLLLFLFGVSAFSVLADSASVADFSVLWRVGYDAATSVAILSVIGYFSSVADVSVFCFLFFCCFFGLIYFYMYSAFVSIANFEFFSDYTVSWLVDISVVDYYDDFSVFVLYIGYLSFFTVTSSYCY